MKVLEITGEPIMHGGQEQFIYNFVSHLHDENFQIDVLTPYNEDNNTFKNLIVDNGGEVVSFDLPFNPGRSRRFLLKPINNYLLKHRYDIVHIHSGSISVLAYVAKAAYLAGVKKIIVHSHCTGIPSIRHSITKLAFSRMLTKYPTDYFACSYDAGSDKFSSVICRNELVVIKNGIDTSRFKENGKTRSIIRKQLGLTEEDYVIGHVGRFSFQKNHEFLIDVYRNIKNTYPNIFLLLVGDGELKDDVYSRVKCLGLEESVIFTGNVTNTQDYYQAMDVFLFPSRYEGFGLVALEAQAIGLPCLISSNVPDDVIIGDNTRRIALDDPQSWIDQTEHFINKGRVKNKTNINKAGYNIRETVKQIQEVYLKQ